MNRRKCILYSVFLFIALTGGAAEVRNGILTLATNQLESIGSFNLTPAEWLYKPGYSITTNEKPQLDYEHTGFVPITVPQFLNRVHWWLDDSEDFKKHEDG